MSPSNHHIILAFLQAVVLLCVLFCSNCARTFNPNIERGSTYKYQQGFPEVRISTIGFWGEENRSYIDIVADIVYGSLFYERKGDKRTASLSIQILVFAPTENDKVITALGFPYTLEVNDHQMTQSPDTFTLKRKVRVKPGKYRIEFTVIDNHTNRRTMRVSETDIPRKIEFSSLTNIRLLGKARDSEGKTDTGWFPITTYDVPSKLDSLKFIYQVNVHYGDTLILNSKLVKFNADMSPALPMDRPNYSHSSLPFKGIDFRENEVIQTNRRVISQPGDVSVEIQFPVMGQGNYRFEINIDGSSSTSTYKARDFGIRSPNYPALKSPEELARPLVYLMNNNEYKTLMSISDSESLKLEVDRFWLKNIRNKSDAKSIIRLYYERVEEANKMFSNFKEGWQTDLGMIYILFGPPVFITETPKEKLWAYSYNAEDQEYNFTFKRAKIKSEFYPFDHFILQRSKEYYSTMYRQTQLWLTGQIIYRKI